MSETRTETAPATEQQTEAKSGILPPYAVILHNDDVNEMGHVVRSLHRSVPSLTIARATDIMMEAHNHGRALVIVCPLMFFASRLPRVAMRNGRVMVRSLACADGPE